MLSFVARLNLLSNTLIRRLYNVGLFCDNKLQIFYCAAAQIGARAPPLLRFLNHTKLKTHSR